MSTKIKFSNLSVDEILQIVEPIMDNCLEGSNEDDHQKHTRDFTDRMKNIVTPENLKKQLSHSPRSYFTKREFLNIFRRDKSIAVVWKQYISNSNNELINQAIFVEINKRIFMINIFFFKSKEF